MRGRYVGRRARRKCANMAYRLSNRMNIEMIIICPFVWNNGSLSLNRERQVKVYSAVSVCSGEEGKMCVQQEGKKGVLGQGKACVCRKKGR